MHKRMPEGWMELWRLEHLRAALPMWPKHWDAFVYLFMEVNQIVDDKQIFLSRIYQGVFHEAIFKKQTNKPGKITIGNMDREQKGFCLVKAWQTTCVSDFQIERKSFQNHISDFQTFFQSFQTHSSLALYTSGLPRKTNGEGALFWKSDINQSLYHSTWRWKKGKHNSALCWQSLRGEPPHFTHLKPTFLQSHFLHRVTTNNHLHLTPPAGDRLRSLTSSPLLLQWQKRRCAPCWMRNQWCTRALRQSHCCRAHCWGRCSSGRLGARCRRRRHWWTSPRGSGRPPRCPPRSPWLSSSAKCPPALCFFGSCLEPRKPRYG